jgi:adenylate kinase family enzyme
MRLLVFGNSGSGKSTLARRLCELHGLVHLDLDSIVWEPGKIAVQRATEDVRADLDRFVAGNESWVVEGCYAELIERALPFCTRIVFMNPGAEACRRNNERRDWEPHKYTSKDDQDRMLPFLQTWVAEYYSRDDAWSYSAHRRLFDGFGGDKLELTEISDGALPSVFLDSTC